MTELDPKVLIERLRRAMGDLDGFAASASNLRKPRLDNVHGINAQAIDDTITFLAALPSEGPVAGSEATGWQPIETAPKDGTTFLGFDTSNPHESFDLWHWDPKVATDGADGFWVNQADSSYDEYPKLWRPLPASPIPHPESKGEKS